MRSVVVTGVSTGIGLACAEGLLAAGWRVFGSVRTEARGAELKAKLGDTFTPLLFDVTDGPAILRAAEQVRAALGGQKLGGLVNNAGIAVAGPLAHLPIEEMQHQLDVNVLGPMRTAQAFIPLLGADRSLAGEPGRIVQISSVAGKVAMPFLGPYVASKHALEGMSHALRRELMLHGIDVVIIGPGAVATPIWDKAEQIDDAPYAHTEYIDAMRKVSAEMLKGGRKGYPPSRIAEAVRTALETSRPKTRYAVVPDWFAGWTVPTSLPDRTLDGLLGKAFGLLKR